MEFGWAGRGFCQGQYRKQGFREPVARCREERNANINAIVNLDFTAMVYAETAEAVFLSYFI